MGKERFSGRLTLALDVRDRKASIQWYQETLGCRLLYDVAEAGWCELSSPVEAMNIGLSDRDSSPSAPPVPTFEVHDLDDTRAHFEAQGVRFEGETVVIEGLAKLATFFDPDGHRLMLAQDLQGGGQ